MPRKPSSFQIVAAVPCTPRYAALGSSAASLRGWKPPCACNFVLMTSSGQLTMPESAPASAPEIGTIQCCGRRVTKYSKGPVVEDTESWLRVVGSASAEAAVSGVDIGDAGVRSNDILGRGTVELFTEYASSTGMSNGQTKSRSRSCVLLLLLTSDTPQLTGACFTDWPTPYGRSASAEADIDNRACGD